MDEKIGPVNEHQPRPRESVGVFWSLISGLIIYQLLWGSVGTIWVATISVVAAAVLCLIYLKAAKARSVRPKEYHIGNTRIRGDSP